LPDGNEGAPPPSGVRGFFHLARIPSFFCLAGWGSVLAWVVVRAKDLVSTRKVSNSRYTYFPMETGVPKDAIPLNPMTQKVIAEGRAPSDRE